MPHALVWPTWMSNAYYRNYIDIPTTIPIFISVYPDTPGKPRCLFPARACSHTRAHSSKHMQTSALILTHLNRHTGTHTHTHSHTHIHTHTLIQDNQLLKIRPKSQNLRICARPGSCLRFLSWYFSFLGQGPTLSYSKKFLVIEIILSVEIC